MTTMPFGKHKGCALADVPLEYLRWVVTVAKTSKLRAAVVAEIARRATGRYYEKHDPSPRNPLTREDVRRLALEIVTRGYRAAAREHHPDLGGDVEDMKRVNLAAEALRELLGGTA